MQTKKLDNPAWYSLSEVQKEYCIDLNGVKFFDPVYCPFGAIVTPNEASPGIDAYALLLNNFFILGEKPVVSNKIRIVNNLICRQMMLEKPIVLEGEEKLVELHDVKQRADLYELVNLVQPGYFRSKTSYMGRYYGIYKEEMLVAAAGERMKMNDFTEVSAVVTHQNFTDRGYASQLIAHVSNKIFEENKHPYLHVADTNEKAIKIYEKLGFRERRKISFWNLSSVHK